MKLHLPSDALTEGKAAFELERGSLAGQSFTASFFVCSKPACDCGEVSFHCTPKLRETTTGQPDHPRYYFTLALERREVVRRDPARLTPEAGRLAAAFLEEM